MSSDKYENVKDPTKIPIPAKGTINLHASLLPNLRGAAPIHWAIINGLKETGVSTFYINENIDCGEVIEQKKVSISENESSSTLRITGTTNPVGVPVAIPILT